MYHRIRHKHRWNRGSPDSSRDRQMKKDRRSHSPMDRKMSPKRGNRHLGRKSRSPIRMANRGRGAHSGNRRPQASPIRRPSLSPRRKMSPDMKRRSPDLQSKRSGAMGMKRISPNRQQSTARRSFSPRRMDSRIHSNTRSQSSRGRPFHKSSPQRPLSRSPVSAKKKRLSPSPPSHQNENRRKNTDSNDNAHYKDRRVVDKQHRLKRGDSPGPPGQSHGFSAQNAPAYNSGDIDERFERRSRSPSFVKNERFSDGPYREMDRGYQNDGAREQQGSEDSRNNNFPSGSASYKLMADEAIGNPSNTSNSGGAGKIYTQEELKTITVDIFRSVPPDGATGKRNNFNPNDVVVVRRLGEGVRPIFDRDEIRQAHVERGDSAFIERRVVAIVKDRSRSRSPRNNSNAPPEFQGLEERENFQISSEHFNSYGHNDQASSTRPSLNDRWQKLEFRNIDREAGSIGNNRKNLPRNMGPGGYPSRDSHNDYGFSGTQQYSRSPSPNFRQYSDNRYDSHLPNYTDEWAARREPPPNEEREHYPYDQEAMRRRYLAVNPHDLRHSLATKRRRSLDPHPRTTRHSPENRDHGRSWFKEREFQDTMSRSRERGVERRAPDTTSDMRGRDLDRGRTGNEANWNRQDERDGRDMFNQGRLPNFSSRPDKYRYQEWLDKPDVVPKGPSYFEHDTRGEAYLRDSSNRGFGVRGRGRGFPMSRGGRGNFRARGAPYPYHTKAPFNRPGNKWSPNHWKHDRFESTPDRMSEQEKPSSTTNK